MNDKKISSMNDKLLSEIISAAYGDAGFLVKRKIIRLAKQNKEVNRIYNEYLQTAAAVSEIAPDECPPDIVAAAVKKTVSSSPKKSFYADLFNIYFRRPALAAVSGLMIIAAILTSLFIHNNKISSEQRQAALAERQVRESLAIVGKVLRKSEIIIENKIFRENIGDPLKKGVREVTNLIN